MRVITKVKINSQKCLVMGRIIVIMHRSGAWLPFLIEFGNIYIIRSDVNYYLYKVAIHLISIKICIISIAISIIEAQSLLFNML